MKVLVLALAWLLLPACVPGATPLPTATARLHFSSVEMPRGSYCWNSGGRGECADSVGPDVLLRTGYLKPYATAGGYDVEVIFKDSPTPSTLEVDLAYGPGSPATVQVTAPRTFALPQVPSDKAGVYVFAVTGRWSEGDVTFFLALDLMPGVA